MRNTKLEQELKISIENLRVIARRIEEDRKEPDKILCHAQSARQFARDAETKLLYMRKNYSDATKLRGIFQEQLTNAIMFSARLVEDYEQCVKEKAIADRSCGTWDETVVRLVELSKNLGTLEAHLSSIQNPI